MFCPLPTVTHAIQQITMLRIIWQAVTFTIELLGRQSILGCVHTWCPSTSTRAPAQNGAVFRHWVPDISLPSSVPESRPCTRARALCPNSGVGT